MYVKIFPIIKAISGVLICISGEINDPTKTPYIHLNRFCGGIVNGSVNMKNPKNKAGEIVNVL
jgi:hypothetical protein